MNEDLYQKQIIEWSKKADHIIKLEHANCRATASNPLCGDRISVELELDGDIIKAISCQIKGCLLCKASGSILAERARGLGFNEIKKLFSDLENGLKSPISKPDSFPEDYRIFFPVRSRKSRHSCVLLPFDTVLKAILDYRTSSVTER